MAKSPFFFSFDIAIFSSASQAQLLSFHSQERNQHMSEQIPAPKAQGLGTVIMNVFSAPGDAFKGLRESESKPSYWLVPLLVTLVLVVIVMYILATNDVFRQQIIDDQSQQLNAAVAQGKMSQDQAAQAIERTQNAGTGIFMAFGIVFASIAVILYFFLGSLFLWLANKFVLKSSSGYSKHLEVYGIANWIGILGGIVTIMLMYLMNSMHATPSAALAVVSQYDVTNKVHKLLSSLDIFVFWQTVVIGIGLSSLASKKASSGIVLALVLWAIWIPTAIWLNIAR
jgi:hypothetical protein